MGMQARPLARAALAGLAAGALLLCFSALALIGLYHEMILSVAATGNGPLRNGPAGTYGDLARTFELLGFWALGLGGIVLATSFLLDTRAPETRRRLAGLAAGLAAIVLFGPFWEALNPGGPRTSLARELGLAAGLATSIIVLAWPDRTATVAASACAAALVARGIHAASMPPYWPIEHGAWPPQMWLAIWSAAVTLLLATTLTAAALSRARAPAPRPDAA